MKNGVNQDFRNTSSEIFVGSIGDTNAEMLKFFNVSQPAKESGSSLQSQAYMTSLSGSTVNPKFKEIKKVELQQEGIAHIAAFSGKTHLAIVMASVNGSLFVWAPRPAKIIQPLAPNFVEIEDNVVFIEREDEFESEISSEEETPEEHLGDRAFARSLISELTKKQRKLAHSEPDIYGIDPQHSMSMVQKLMFERPTLNTELEGLFQSEEGKSSATGHMQVVNTDSAKSSCFVKSRIDVDDSFAVMARRNLDFFRDKFDRLLIQK